jgi:glutathione synthase
MKLAFIIDPIAKLDPTHDTSVAIMEAACKLGHEVYITSPESLSIVNSQAWARLEPVKVAPVSLGSNGKWQAVDPWYELQPGKFEPLTDMDAVWIRTDPPVTMHYVYATYMLDYLDPARTLILNSPHGIRTANEKLYALQFAQFMPETIVSSSKKVLRDFVAAKGQAILKPIDGKGGEGILFAKDGDRNLNSMIEISTKFGREPIVAQVFIPEASLGDKRIILLDGEPIGAVNRIPASDEIRGNMAAGGSVAKTEITDREKEICARIAPVLRRDGLLFVGIDVIGGYLTEINVTSPTGIREIDRLEGVHLGEKVIYWLESYLRR